MQDRYTGDIADYIKYGLLRSLANNRKLGIAWYLYPDENHNSDGRHIGYLQYPDLWRARDPELFDAIKKIVEGGRRCVTNIEESGILKGAKFSRETLLVADLSPEKRAAWRLRWFESVKEALSGCELVFADPDNGLCEDFKFRATQLKFWKRIPLSEARTLARDRTAVIYHHNTRRKGGHEREIRYWMEQLGAGTLALRWRAYSSRSFFILNPKPDMHEQLARFACEWGPKAEFYY